MKLSAALMSEAAAMTTLTAQTVKPKSLVSGGGDVIFCLSQDLGRVENKP